MIISLKKTRIHIKNKYVWRELKLPAKQTVYILKDRILNEMICIEGGIADTIDDHIERNH